MTEPEQVRTLLTSVAEPSGELAAEPLSHVLAIARGMRRRRRIGSVVLAAGLVVAVAVPAAVFGARATQSRRPVAPVPAHTAYPSTGPGTAAALAKGHWSSLPTAPVEAGADGATVWTGRELIFWGGVSDNGTLHGDGATYSPTTNQWQVLPAAPLAPRRSVASVWTGAVMFIWGGLGMQPHTDAPTAAVDGALYDPRTRHWHRLPPAPLSGRIGARAVWTGHEVLVVGGDSVDSTGAHDDAAAYDPATDRWRRLPSLPVRPGYEMFTLTALAAGDAVYVLATSDHVEHRGTLTATRFVADLWHCTGSCAEWRPDGVSDNLVGLRGALWTGLEILVPADYPFLGAPGPVRTGLHGWRLRPGVGGWQAMEHGPVDDSPHVSVWAGAALVSIDTQGKATAWDPVADRWTRLPDAPRPVYSEATAVWTGNQILVVNVDRRALSFG